MSAPAPLFQARVAHDRSCLVLIDFDNILPPGEDSLSAELLSHQLVGLLKSALVTHPSLEHFVIRLYGGWYEGGTLTNRGSEVAQLVSQVDLFPLAIPGGAILRGDVQLANELLSLPSVQLGSTFQRRSGLPRLRLAKSGTPTDCAVPESGCPVDSYFRLSKKKTAVCPAAGCEARVADCFIVREQKMVDTLLACDVVEGVCQGPGLVVVLSSDSDLVPALLQASQIDAAQVALVADRGLLPEEHVDLLRSLNIDVRLREA